MTNGAIRSPNKDTLPSTLHILEKELNIDLDTFDLSAFVLPKSNTKGPGQKPIAQDKTAKEITQFIQESDDLFKMGQKYEIEVVARGHQSLYECCRRSKIDQLGVRLKSWTDLCCKSETFSIF